ncbi:TonB-dependent receptor [Acinetobacter calcoaceticus]|uniref:Iron complex outermembrane receptor protein n=1 Tax=Acinetobacter calcoaceticus TaxID=471 RepID=A0ABD5AIX3_ACICA|nr:TonB-dependent receptor [Acinetobacter calcoaceticus]MDP9802276.1 iron complex outermembrane receptor protein [Acinetobacter calcoaceticus]
MSKFLLNPLAWSILFAQFSMSAMAQSQPHSQTTELEKITIKAEDVAETSFSSTGLTQFEHSLLSVPFTKSHVSAEDIKNNNIQRVSDALSRVNGVVYQDSYGGGFWDNYSFRGFSTDPNMGTSYLRNSLSSLSGIHTPRDMVNIQAIDFLKGPMAAMYGQGAIGGIMNITTKQPEWTQKNEVSLSGSTLEEYRASLDSTGALNNALAYRLGLAYENNQSFRDQVDSQHYFVAPQLAWKISDQTQLNLDTEFSEHQGVFDRGVPMDNGQFVVNKKTFLGEPSDGDIKVKDQMYQLRLNHQFNENWNNTTALSYNHGERAGTSTEISSIAADGQTANRFRRYRQFETDTFQLQSILRGKFNTGAVKHELVANVEAGHYTIDQTQLRNAVGTSSPINIYNPVYGQNILALARTTKNSKETQNMLGVNLQDQIFLNPEWNVLIGGRFNRLEQQIDDYKTGLSDQQDFTPFSPRVGVNYQPTTKLSFYSNWGKAFELNTGLNKDNQLYDPEKTQSWEIGAKYEYLPQSWLGLTYFDLDKQHLLTEGITDTYVDSGRVQSHGVEVELKHQFNDHLRVGANYTFTKASVIESEVDTKGARLKNIPKHTANLNADYQFELLGREAGLVGTINYFGKRSANYIDNGTSLPEFTVVNVGGYVQVRPDLRAQLNIDNVFDKDYYVSSYTDEWVQPGEPLKATLSLTWNF